MLEISYGRRTVIVQDGGLPEIYGEYRRHASLVEEFDLQSSEGAPFFLGVAAGIGSAGPGWPEVVIAQRYDPHVSGFSPGALIAEETDTLFVGAGTRLLAYDLSKPVQLWEDYVDVGFWCWRQHGDFALMSAELELAAWSTRGQKLWTTFVEPPWDYRIEGDRVALDVMGRKSSFGISVGPVGK